MHDLAVHPAGGAGGGSPVLGLSLCAGAGGLDLGLHLALPGYRTVGHVERDAYAAAVLVARMEDAALGQAPVWDDVAGFDGRPWRQAVDIVLAGYPCQPFSIAGRRLGDKDPRHLWPHIARIVGECRPPLVFLENVAHHLRLGFPDVAGELVGLGYRLAAGLFSAAEVGAPHRRERLFVLAAAERQLADAARLLRPAVERSEPDRAAAGLADAGSAGLAFGGGERGDARPERETAQRGGHDVEHAEGERRRQGRAERPPRHRQPDAAGAGGADGGAPAFPPGPDDGDGWRDYLARAPQLEPAVRRGADGLARGLVDGVDLRWRVDRLRCLGNGVVPLVAAHALRTLAARLIDVAEGDADAAGAAAPAAPCRPVSSSCRDPA